MTPITPADLPETLNHCPICGLPWDEPRQSAELRGSFDICDCCGCEYGYDDTPTYRQQWLAKGAKWFNPKHRPNGWDLAQQLKNSSVDWLRARSRDDSQDE